MKKNNRMNKTHVLVLLTLCIGVFTVSCTGRKETSGTPNLLFIMTDQHQFYAMGMAGNEVIQTPNLDQMARNGAWFTNTYTQSAVCVPARATILSGHTLENSGVLTNNHVKELEESGIMAMKTFDEILHDNGYACEYYGKWHAPIYRGRVYQNEVPVAGGKDSTELGRGMRRQFQDYLDKHCPNRKLEKGEFYDRLSGRPYKADPIDLRYRLQMAGKETNIKLGQNSMHGVLDIPAEHSITAMHARQTIEAIGRLKDKPFTITCSFNPPHPPMLSVELFRSMYNPQKMVVPESIHDDMENSPYINVAGRLKNTEYADEELIKYMISNYYALVTEIDYWIGKILDKLEEEGLIENTLVIYTSDHGEMLGAHGMRDKFTFLEESSHVPLIIKYPGKINEGTIVKGYVSTIDLFATILDYMGIDIPLNDGKSLRGLIEGRDIAHGKYVVTEWHPGNDNVPNYMVLKDGWKLILPCTAESKVIDALYDLNTDPHEMTNLIGSNPENEKYRDKVEELRGNLLEWLGRTHSRYYNGVKERQIIK